MVAMGKPTTIILTPMLLLISLSISVMAQSTTPPLPPPTAGGGGGNGAGSGPGGGGCSSGVGRGIGFGGGGAYCSFDIAYMKLQCCRLFGDPLYGYYPTIIPPTPPYYYLPTFCGIVSRVTLTDLFRCHKNDMMITECMIGLMKYCGRRTCTV